MKLNTQSFALNLKHNKRAATIFPQLLILVFIVLLSDVTNAQSDSAVFAWPEGKHAAVSLSFDDARESQVISGTPLLDQYGVKATFYVVPSTMEKQLDGWKKAVTNGHEIGITHSLIPAPAIFHGREIMRWKIIHLNKYAMN